MCVVHRMSFESELGKLIYQKVMKNYLMRLAVLLAIAVVLLFVANCSNQQEKTVEEPSVTPDLSHLPEADQDLILRSLSYFGIMPDSILSDDYEISETMIRLGQMLWHDARLSKSSFISCNSCHNLGTFGVDNLPTSVGHNWQLGRRNAPTVLNAAFHTTQFWDGRAPDVEVQATMPIMDPVEMAIPHEEITVDRIASISEYVDLFNEVFADEEKPISLANIGRAIGAFERTLITPSRFDDYMRGDADALNEQEKRGLNAFMVANCQTCHMTHQLGGHIYQKFGVMQDYWELTGSEIPDVGRSGVTMNENEMYFFKVPGLRNVTRTYPYFHDGSVWSLKEAVSIMNELQFGERLNDSDLDDIVAFLGALEGELPDAARVIPILPPSTAATPKPDMN